MVSFNKESAGFKDAMKAVVKLDAAIQKSDDKGKGKSIYDRVQSVVAQLKAVDTATVSAKSRVAIHGLLQSIGDRLNTSGQRDLAVRVYDIADRYIVHVQYQEPAAAASSSSSAAALPSQLRLGSMLEDLETIVSHSPKKLAAELKKPDKRAYILFLKDSIARILTAHELPSIREEDRLSAKVLERCKKAISGFESNLRPIKKSDLPKIIKDIEKAQGHLKLEYRKIPSMQVSLRSILVARRLSTTIKGVDLTQAGFAEDRVWGVRAGTDLLKNINLGGVHFENCKLSWCNFSGAQISGSKFENCDLRHCVFKDGAEVKDVKFTKCDFSRGQLSEICMENVIFSDCCLAHTGFTNSSMDSVEIIKSDLRGAYFPGAIVKDSHIRNSKNVREALLFTAAESFGVALISKPPTGIALPWGSDLPGAFGNKVETSLIGAVGYPMKINYNPDSVDAIVLLEEATIVTDILNLKMNMQAVIDEVKQGIIAGEDSTVKGGDHVKVRDIVMEWKGVEEAIKKIRSSDNEAIVKAKQIKAVLDKINIFSEYIKKNKTALRGWLSSIEGNDDLKDRLLDQLGDDFPGWEMSTAHSMVRTADELVGRWEQRADPKGPCPLPEMRKILQAAEQVADTSSCIVLPGGDNVEEPFYMKEGQIQMKLWNDFRSDLRRSLMEFSLIHQARQRGIPLMGICRGCQMIGVYHGTGLMNVKNQMGSMGKYTVLPPATSPKISSASRASSSSSSPSSSSSSSSESSGGQGLIRSLVSSGKVRGMSYHYQAVDVRETDSGKLETVIHLKGMPKAMEGTEGSPLLAFQFHPEAAIDQTEPLEKIQGKFLSRTNKKVWSQIVHAAEAYQQRGNISAADLRKMAKELKSEPEPAADGKSADGIS